SACFGDLACPDDFVVCYNCVSDAPPRILDTVLRQTALLTVPVRALVQYRLTQAVAAGQEISFEVRPSVGATFGYALAGSQVSVVRQGPAATDNITLISGGTAGSGHAVFRVRLSTTRGLAVSDELHLDMGPSAGAELVVPSPFANFDSIRLFALLKN